MDKDCEVSKRDPTIPSLDSNLDSIIGRLSEIVDDLNSGVWGNANKTEDCDSSPMETPSLASLARRIDYIFSHLSDVERLVKKIHSSTPVCTN